MAADRAVGAGEEPQPGDPDRIGPYRVVRRLGGGGTGLVFLGRSAGGRAVVLKVIRADLAADPEFRARLQSEVDALRKVSSLYIAPLVDDDLDGPAPWLAAAYVAGPSLADAVAQRGPLPPASVVMLAAGLAESLVAMHAVGVVHRDLRPSHVLLADDGPRITDFGISRAAAGVAGFGAPDLGSPDSGAPRDVFSLGAVVAFAATGRGPFGTGASYSAAADLGGVPVGIRALVERCLNREPDQRPMAAELLAELGDMEVQQAPPPQRPAAAPAAAAAPIVAAVPGVAAAPMRPVLIATLADLASTVAYAVAFRPDGEVLAVADGNGRVYLWDVPSGKSAGSFADPGSRGVIGVAFDPDSELLAAADSSGRVCLWDVVNSELATTFVRRHIQGMTAVAFGLGGDVVAAAGANGRIFVWDVVHDKVTRTFGVPGSEGVNGVAFGLGDCVLAAGDGNGRVYLWDVVSGGPAGAFAVPDSRGVNDVAFGLDDRVLAAGDGNGRVYLWDAASGRPAGVFAVPDSRGVNGVDFYVNDSGAVLLAAGDGNGRVYLWDVVSGRPAGAFANPESRGVNGVVFSPDGALLAAADGNGRTYLWRTTA